MQEILDMNGNWRTQSEANCKLSGLIEKKRAALTYLGLDITNSLKYHPHIMINSNWKFSPSSLSGT